MTTHYADNYEELTGRAPGAPVLPEAAQAPQEIPAPAKKRSPRKAADKTEE